MLNTSEKDNKSNLPNWEDYPEPQIVEITPEPAEPELPPALEKDLIDNILNGDPTIFELPKPKQPESNCLN